MGSLYVMKTGELKLKLLEILHREHPVFITGMGLQCTYCFGKKTKPQKLFHVKIIWMRVGNPTYTPLPWFLPTHIPS